MFEINAPRTEMDVLSSAADGMGVARSLLDVAARNVAAAQASSPDHPYSRLVAEAGRSAPLADDSSDGPADMEFAADDAAPSPVRVHTQPGSSDALAEMVAVLDAQRAYEQNASIFDLGKRLAERTIDVGRS